jgi:hypothetical protein
MGLRKCSECRSYATCNELCKKAEKYVDQDFRCQQELLIGVVLYQGNQWPIGEVEQRGRIFTPTQWGYILKFLADPNTRNLDPLKQTPWIREIHENLSS